jgi:hypothetical protein
MLEERGKYTCNREAAAATSTDGVMQLSRDRWLGCPTPERLPQHHLCVPIGARTYHPHSTA